MMTPSEFEEALGKGKSIKDALLMGPEFIEKLGFVLSPDAEDLSKQLWANRRKTWASLLAFENREEAVDAAGGDKVSGGTLWGAIVRYREREAALREERSRSQTTGQLKKLRLTSEATTPEDKFLAGLAKIHLDDKRLILDREVFDTKDKVIFVRSCYPKLFELCFPLVNDGENCVVTGTPGIGKSMFGYYALHELLKRGITVIYIYMGWECCHLYLPQQPSGKVAETLSGLGISIPETGEGGWLGRFIPNGATELAPNSKQLYGALTELSGDVIVILDPPRGWGGDLFKNPPCGLLVVTSPTPERVTAVDAQSGSFTFYMPLWTLDELKDLLLARQGGGQISVEEEGKLQLRSLRFGDIPRYIARVGVSHEQMIQLSEQKTQSAIQQLSGSTMAQVVNPISAVPQVSGRIIHLVPSDNLQSARKKFASEMIERQILVHFHRIERHGWATFAASVHDVDGCSQMLGVRSEIWWHSALQAGGLFTLQQLFNKTSHLNRTYRRGPSREITFPESAARYSARQKLSDIRGLWDLDSSEKASFGGLYFHFLKGNVPAIDSIWVLDGAKGKEIFDPESPEPAPPVYVCGVQMTLNKKHALNLEGINNFMGLVANFAPSGARVEIILVTDESLQKDLHYILVKEYPELRQWLMNIPSDRIFA